MAVLNVTPDSKNISGTVSSTSGGDFVVGPTKLVPRNADGSIFDCTGTTAATLTINQAAPPTTSSTQSTASAVIDAADATGLTLHFPEGQATNALNAMGIPGRYPAAIVATQGSNTYLANQGSYTLTSQ